MLSTYLEHRRLLLQKLIEDQQEKLLAYPKEHLIISHTGPYSKWYKSDGKVSTYIPKREKEQAVRLAHKKYETCLLEDYRQELSLIESFLAKNQPAHSKAEVLLKDTAFLELFSLHPSIMSNDCNKWTDETYVKNPRYPEQLQHKCLSGELVRSKSEVIIANTLFTNHIPYRYEALLSLGDTSFYPDFTILNPSTLQIIYWEHFGMMDIPTYSDNAFNKLKKFGHYGIIPGINLIATFETSHHPIDSEQILQLITTYFKS